MDLQLTGKVAIVTGASRGIGRAIAACLAEEGMRLVLAARSKQQLEVVAGSLMRESLVCPLDLREPGAPAALVAAAVERFGQIDVLVNNAGATARGDFLKLKDSEWQDGYALKFFGAMRCARAAWPHLRKVNGSLIFISGVGGRTGNAEFTIGGSVNAALHNLTKALSDRGIKEGVRVNAINPGSILTDRLRSRVTAFATEHELELPVASERMARALRVARFGEPMEVGRAVAYLASPLAAYCQGVLLDVDGGQTRAI